MAVRDILKMGDARLLRVAQPVKAFGTSQLMDLLTDLMDTMATDKCQKAFTKSTGSTQKASSIYRLESTIQTPPTKFSPTEKLPEATSLSTVATRASAASPWATRPSRRSTP